LTAEVLPPAGPDTPYASVDLDAVERNIERMQRYCDSHGIAFRPHVKTHRLPAIAHRQIRAGAVGITCQKLGEAAVMVAAGIEDVLVSYPLLGEAKLERLRGLAEVARISIAADSAEVATGLSQALASRGSELDFLVECDTGLRRTGVQTPEQALDLARLIDGLPGLRFAGLMTYPTGPDTGPFFAAARELIEGSGIEVGTLSGGGTADALRTHELASLTELRAGTYVFGDRGCIANGSVAPEDCALRVHATVVSRPTPTRAILDAGSKVLTTDAAEAAGTPGYGLLVERPLALVDELFEEHARVELSPEEPPLELGEIVSIVPNHACGTTYMQPRVFAHRRGVPVGWWPVTGRGAVR
jgi:D-serine deaminase-like pyridoxal phosphate-dependent protein